MKPRSWACCSAAAALLAAPVLSGAGAAATTGAAAVTDPVTVVRIAGAERTDPQGAVQVVALPDHWVAGAAAAGDARPPVSVLRYRLQAVAPAAQGRPQALYFPGLLAPARVSVNGIVLLDRLDTVAPERPNGAQSLLLVDLPPAALAAPQLTIDVDVATRRDINISPAWVGARSVLAPRHDAKAFMLSTAPLVVATVIGCLGLAVLVLYARRRSESTYAYFGIGALLWALHTLWGTLPMSLLDGIHRSVWWNELYAALVAMLVIFVLRFVGSSRRWIERGLLALCAAAPLVLYGAAAVGALRVVARDLRLVLIVIAVAALVAVARHTWRQRSIDAMLLTLSGLASAGFGARDWFVFGFGSDNNPVELTPFAGLPFVVLVSWLLLDRLVRASAALATMNEELERRVAERESQLARNFEQMALLQREQATADERQRIMRDLHDGLGSQLLVSLSRAERGALQGPAMVDTLRGAIDQMRVAIDALASDEQDLGTSFGNFRYRWDARLRDAGLLPTWTVDLADDAPPFRAHETLQLLRIVQEALTNVVKHAQATRVQVTLLATVSELELAVDDDGIGISVDSGGDAASAGGRGVANMRHRASRLGATLALAAGADGHGTQLQLRLPLHRVAHTA